MTSKENKTLLKTLEGIEIFVDNETGQFSAKIAGKTVKKRNLRDVEKEIEAISGAVTAYDLDYNYIRSPHKVEVIRFENGRARRKDGRLAGYSERYYLLDTETVSKLEAMAEEYRRLRERYQELLSELPRLNESNIEEVRKSQKSE